MAGSVKFQIKYKRTGYASLLKPFTFLANTLVFNSALKSIGKFTVEHHKNWSKLVGVGEWKLYR